MREPGDILLLSCYELGHQPLGLATTAAFLERAGFRPACIDLSVEGIDPGQGAAARLTGISVPMHTALRIGVQIGRRVRRLNPSGHITYFGLYASLNAAYLFADGEADSVIGGEFEAPLLELAESLATGRNGVVPGVAAPGRRAPPHLARLAFPVPSRAGLQGLERYAHLELDGRRVAAGYVEASRGCLHLCRHCPIPPIYGGRFFVVPLDVVLADVDALVALGAGHITFGDPDFWNGPGHVMAIVREMHRRHPAVTFDATIKIENILQHRALVPELRALGCAFVVSAVESLSDEVLARLDKGHTRADVGAALAVMRAAGLPLRPTFVPFTPWSTAPDYLDLLAFIESEGLIDHVDPVQLALRLLLPPGSLLLADPTLRPRLGRLDRERFTHRWTHPDPRLDRLHAAASALIEAAAARGDDPMATFYAMRDLAHRELTGRAAPPAPAFPAARERARPPRLTEDWFC